MQGFIRVADDGHGFVDAAGKPFVPFGANYFDPLTGWAPKIWSQYDHDRVARHMDQMAEAGLNCIRVFLDRKTLSPAPDEYSEEGFAKVADMVKCAASAGIRIDFSGPNMWEGRAKHLSGDMYADDAQLGRLCRLWEQIVRRWGDDPTVMTWDLQNEPMVGWAEPGGRNWDDHLVTRLGPWKQRAKAKLGIEVDTLPSPRSAGQDRAVYAEYVRFLEDLAEHWTARQCEAIRAAGAKQMITIGLIQWSVPVYLGGGRPYSGFHPAKVAPHLDYTSMHFYPILQNPAAGLDGEFKLQRAYCSVIARAGYVPGKPLVMEEFGWKGGKQVPKDPRAWPQEHQSVWGDAFMRLTRNVANGWLNWGYADAASDEADISAASGLWTEDEKLKHWGRRFCEHAAELKAQPPTYRPPEKTWTVSRTDFLYDHDGYPKMDALLNELAADSAEDVEVVFTD